MLQEERQAAGWAHGLETVAARIEAFVPRPKSPGTAGTVLAGHRGGGRSDAPWNAALDGERRVAAADAAKERAPSGTTHVA